MLNNQHVDEMTLIWENLLTLILMLLPLHIFEFPRATVISFV